MNRFRLFTLAALVFSFFSGSTVYAQANAPADEAYAPVYISGKWGFINKQGILRLTFLFDQVGNFSEGMAPVSLGPNWGYVNRNGTWLLKPVFRMAHGFNNGRAHTHFYDRADTFNHDIYINKKGELIFELEQGERGFDFHDGLVRILSGDKMGAAVGYKDTAGAWAIKPHYHEAMDFNEGFAPVMLGNYWGYIDRRNRYLVVPQYEEVSPFSEGLAYVKNKGETGFIDTSAKWAFKTPYETGPVFSEGMVAFYDTAGKVGFLNIQGKIVIKPLYENTFAPIFKEGLAPVKKGGRWGYIDNKGTVVIPFLYEQAFNFREERARIKLNGKFGFIDPTGKIIAEPIYDNAGDYTPTY